MTHLMTWPTPRLPAAPTSLRLRGPSGIRPPLGLARFSDEAVDLAVALGSAHDLDDVVRQIPPCESLPGGALVVVLEDLGEAHGGIARWLRPKGHAPAPLRASALLARGYERIGGGVDPKTGQSLVWGSAPLSSRPSPAP
jgi:hypothetical protein